MESPDHEIGSNWLRTLVEQIGILNCLILLAFSTLVAGVSNPNSLPGKLLPIWGDPVDVEPHLEFLVRDGVFSLAVDDADARRLYMEHGGPEGPYRRIDVLMKGAHVTRGIWVPTSSQRQVWVLRAAALVTAIEEDEYAPIAPRALPYAYAVWRHHPQIRPYVELLEAQGYTDRVPGPGVIVKGPWRANWWGYAINALTILALAMLTSPLWWKRVQTCR